MVYDLFYFIVSSKPFLSYQSKLCTVVGGCGFLGRHLVEGLLAKGYQVQVFDLRKTFEDDRVKFFTGDLCKKEVCTVTIPLYHHMWTCTVKTLCHHMWTCTVQILCYHMWTCTVQILCYYMWTCTVQTLCHHMWTCTVQTLCNHMWITTVQTLCSLDE